MKDKSVYDKKAEMLLVAIDLVYEFYENDTKANFTEENLAFVDKIHNHYKNIIQTSRSMASLKQIESMLFTYFNEASGVEIDEFWNLIKSRNLDFQRKDLLAIIFKRGKIRGRIEYDFVIDVMDPKFAEGSISEKQYIELSEMVGNYEERNK